MIDMIKIKLNKSSRSLIIDPAGVTLGYGVDQISKVIIIANGQTFVINSYEKEDPGPGIDNAWYTIKTVEGTVIIKEIWDKDSITLEDWRIHVSNISDSMQTISD